MTKPIARKPLIEKIGTQVWAHHRGRTWVIKDDDGARRTKRPSKAHQFDGSLRAPMPGKILKVAVSEGSAVKAGQLLVVMEAMKMEYSLRTPANGLVRAIKVKAGQTVPLDTVLVEVNVNADTAAESKDTKS